MRAEAGLDLGAMDDTWGGGWRETKYMIAAKEATVAEDWKEEVVRCRTEADEVVRGELG